jgi:hypothetical protein
VRGNLFLLEKNEFLITAVVGKNQILSLEVKNG